ncbi:MAG: asparagine synthase (glutamine-hydrolyzing) [Pyrinomonadaceae bacterium]
MCGINGIAFSSRSGRQIDICQIQKMRDVIKHRGPDDKGIFIGQGIGFGHRRLSIVDVAGGHQPMTNEDGSLQITYNGEIYNHADYRSLLTAKGHVYKTNCDTETILHLYEEYGDECVNYLRGMFAFAIWDENKRTLFIARDRLGVKPLYYAHTEDGSLYFGSEIKTILAAGAVRPQLDFSVLPDYLANHATSGEATLYRGICRLLPGHTMTWQDGNLTITPYWDINFGQKDPTRESDLIAEWLERFREAVRLRLMADVPLGMFLSGGIDSSAIAAVMSTMVSEPIKTFSVAFKERQANELAYARLIATKYKTDHHEVVLTPDDFFQLLPRMIWHEDEPLAHPSSIALYAVSRLASEHVKVVLTGEGSDELLAGYGRYRSTIYNLAVGKGYENVAPAVLQGLIRSGISHLHFPRIKQKLSRTFLSLNANIEDIYFNNFAVFSTEEQRKLLLPQTIERTGPIDPYVNVRTLLKSSGEDLLDGLLYADVKTYLHELLMKQDQMSMAASIESRVPFLDHKLVEFTAMLPKQLKLRGWTTKYILRKAMTGILPDLILNRKKMGFPVPLAAWFRGPYKSVINQFVLNSRTMDRNIFNPDYLRELVKRHESGEEHSERLWSLVNFEIWMRQVIDQDTSAQAPPISAQELTFVN